MGGHSVQEDIKGEGSLQEDSSVWRNRTVDPNAESNTENTVDSPVNDKSGQSPTSTGDEDASKRTQGKRASTLSDDSKNHKRRTVSRGKGQRGRKRRSRSGSRSSRSFSGSRSMSPRGVKASRYGVNRRSSMPPPPPRGTNRPVNGGRHRGHMSPRTDYYSSRHPIPSPAHHRYQNGATPPPWAHTGGDAIETLSSQAPPPGQPLGPVRPRRLSSGSLRRRNTRSRSAESDSNCDGSSITMEDPILTFKAWILSQNDDNLEPDDAAALYEEYRQQYFNYHAEKFFERNKTSGFLLERYNPEMLHKRYEERKKQCQQTAIDLFKDISIWDGLDLVAPKTAEQQKLLETENEDESSEEKEAKKHRTAQLLESGMHKQSTVEITEHFQAPYYIFDPDINSLMVSSVPKEVHRWDLHEVMKDAHGYLGSFLSPPYPQHNLTRTGWCRFSSEEACTDAERKFKSSCVKETINLKFMRTQMKKRYKVKVTPVEMSMSSRIAKDVSLSAEIIKKLNNHMEIDSSNDVLFQSVRPLSLQLDLQLQYLRRVHHFDYYSCEHCDNERELFDKAGPCFLRPFVICHEEQPSSPIQWVRNLDNSLQELLAKTFVKPQQIGETSEPFRSKWLAHCDEQTLKVDEQKYRCNLCRKLFKGSEFVHKHLKNKHHESYSALLQKTYEGLMRDEYLKDPHKMVIQPPGRTKASTIMRSYSKASPPLHRGHTSTDNHQVRRRPRGSYPSGPAHGPSPVVDDSPIDHSRTLNAVDLRRNGLYGDYDAPPVAAPVGNYRATISYDDI
eukprot:GHVL01044911.1.p1 GENE.GHVL01044911.1~~GHVL01044911.1.p1  ORF type:complete len:786 (-),score=117.57 GHVL01044911.1:3158-5515(-)